MEKADLASKRGGVEQTELHQAGVQTQILVPGWKSVTKHLRHSGKYPGVWLPLPHFSPCLLVPTTESATQLQVTIFCLSSKDCVGASTGTPVMPGELAGTLY